MSKKTQGTRLYAVDPTGNTLITVGCVTSLSGLSASRDQIETTCLEADAKTYEAGMMSPGAASFGLNFDPEDVTHARLHEIYSTDKSPVMNWAVGFSDGTAAPTIDSSGDFVLPGTRSWITFSGYIADIPFDFALSSVVKSTVAVQVSGAPVLVPKVS